MEQSAQQWDFVFVTDAVSKEDQLLLGSLKQAGFRGNAVVMQDNGFLPEGVCSMYALICGRRREAPFVARYYNEITLPDGWTLSAGLENRRKTGKISFRHREKGQIRYAGTKEKYIVDAVDWYDDFGTVRITDHYDRSGDLWAKTIYDDAGQPIVKSWYNEAGQDILLKNYITQDLVYKDAYTERVFRSDADLLAFYLNRTAHDGIRFFINSLGVPYDVCKKAGVQAVCLFLREGGRQNLQQDTGLIKKIIAQDRGTFHTLSEQTMDKEITRLGYLYPFQKKNGHKAEILICTNSDNLEHITDLVAALPDFYFHIAAITNMSEKLLKLGQNRNVHLYPGIKEAALADLYQKCDLYFDVNHHSELLNAVEKAFLHNHLIFAFHETVHNRKYTPDSQIYAAADWEKMVRHVRGLWADELILERSLLVQREFALTETEEAYRAALT